MQTSDAAQNGQILTLQNTQATQGTAITNLQTLTATHSSQIAGLQNNFALLNSQVAGLRHDVNTANEGVAMALSMITPAIPSGSKFAISGGVGYFNRQTAGSAAFAARISSHVSVSGGVGVGFDSGEVGGRVGFQAAW